MKTDSGDQKPDILDTSEETKSNEFLKQVKEEQRDMDMDLFGEQFGYKTPDEMLQTFKNLKNRADVQQICLNIVLSALEIEIKR